MADLIVVLIFSIIVGSLIYLIRMPGESRQKALSEVRTTQWWFSTPNFTLLLSRDWWANRTQTVPSLFQEHRMLVLVFVIANLLDLITTYAAVNVGFTEKNPFVADLVMNRFWLAAIFKLAGTFAIAYGVLLFERVHMFYWFNAGFLFVAFTNALGTVGAHVGAVTPY
ncbi:MAG: DUF5658 family protein [Chloroflexota bacterium]|nr:DUF5658 family protein [Chloroflexota bacterium]